MSSSGEVALETRITSGEVLPWLLVVHWQRVDDVLKEAGDMSGNVVVSCSLPTNADDTGLLIGTRRQVPKNTSRESRAQRRFRRSAPCRARCSSACARLDAGETTEHGLLR
jgi:hypothetical protein